MSKKDYTLIARVIKGGSYLNESARREIAQDFADALGAANSAFKRSLFLKACGV